MLAYMTLYARIPDNGVTVIEQCDFFVLNGVGEVRVLLPYLKEYDSIHCFLDNDEAGRTATKEIAKAYPGISIDESYRYQSYNDLNDFLLEKKQHCMYFSISVVVTNDVAKVIALSSSDQGQALVYDGKISTPTGSI